MKDIDFDELDRAVSSLMNAAPKTEAKDAPKTASLSAEEAVAEEESPVESTTEVQPDEKTTEPVSAPYSDTPVISSESDLAQTKEPEPVEEAPAPASRPEPALAPAPRRGRFMDVVRPAVRETRTSIPSRQGVTLQPIGGLELIEDTASVAAATSEPTETATQQPPATTSMQKSDETVAAPAATTDMAHAETPADMASAFESALSEIVDDAVPQSSPFLPDAKVEKRPLGRQVETTLTIDSTSEPSRSSDDSATEPTEAISTPSQPKTDAQLPEQPLPAELGSELLSIETGADSVSSEVQPVAATPDIKQPEPESDSTPPESTPLRPRAMDVTSIPQQYKVQPQSGEETPVGAIYDTQPLAHPAKKKPSWLIVVAIIVIAALGIGAGASVYYLNLL